MALKRVYSTVNGQAEGKRGTALDEGTIQEQVEAYVKEAKYIAKDRLGSGQTEEQAGKPMDESSVAEAAKAYVKEATYIAKQ